VATKRAPRRRPAAVAVANSLTTNEWLKRAAMTAPDKPQPLPQVASNGWSKPPYSYSSMIGLAMTNAPTGELTVAEIYAFLWYICILFFVFVLNAFKSKKG
jgi:hypothetical protein